MGPLTNQEIREILSDQRRRRRNFFRMLAAIILSVLVVGIPVLCAWLVETLPFWATERLGNNGNGPTPIGMTCMIAWFFSVVGLFACMHSYEEK